ncbi:Aste57867_21922 [Aphanomyces stellatus]|uniref:Aste57867_21922 protein n=1 Tax=Aphanomyces stellatus TaxID=120398 RepID=A0A485LJH5_9STRA|nr:hypothetical protein As57867_021853 [Aphanomyces stellatus]VFT98590.1 Aste57867_21922 [Aphanomyces stellatus]
MPLNALVDDTHAAAIRIQKLYRSHVARQVMARLASSVYRKCYDASTGLYYYCNLKTGETAWERPKIFGNVDAPYFEDASMAAVGDDESLASSAAKDDARHDIPAEAMPTNTAEESSSNQHASSTYQVDKEKKARIEEAREVGRKLIQVQAQAKLDLERQNRKQVRRGRKNWEKRVLMEQEEARAARLRAIELQNKQTIEDLMAGKNKPQLESIREACMRGNLDRVVALLDEGWSSNAESAMGLTPLFAACIGGHVDIVTLLLQHKADVNHRHVITQRTAYMEACQRPHVPVVRELLRYGARLHWTDKQGRVAKDGITSKRVLAMHSLACGLWTPDSSSVFPNPFRAATLALAFVAKCQRRANDVAKAEARKHAATVRVDVQKQLIQAKVTYVVCARVPQPDDDGRYDHEIKQSQLQASVAARRDMAAAADTRFDATREHWLHQAEAAALVLRRSAPPAWFDKHTLLRILAFCPRHWFDTREQMPPPARSRPCLIAPTRVWQSSSTLPLDLNVQLTQNATDIHRMVSEMGEIDAHETIDVATGVSVRVATGESQAQVELTVVEGDCLPKRPNRSLINPFVRVRLHGDDGHALREFEATEPRFEEESPTWDHRFVVDHVPSIRCELCVQLVDLGTKPEMAGEIRIKLRQYVDQKEHDEWHVLPQTLKQTLVEGKSRAVPARLHLLVRFTHAKSLVLARDIAKQTKDRARLLTQQRAYIQTQLARVLALLDVNPAKKKAK